ncbi:MAG: hypothetical protein C0605_16765, partial [Hyphomicrobiales bacterium]
MIKNRPVTAIIPVRGGSKGIPRKNLLRLGRDTLLERAIKLGRHSPRVERIVVSTDDPEMHDIAGRYGAAAPVLRPAHLGGDDVTTVDVVCDLIESADIEPGYLLLLQATSPLRTLADLERMCAEFEAGDAPASVSLSLHEEPHPAKMRVLDQGLVKPFLGAGFEGPRQQLPPVYAFNGAFYLIDRDAFLTHKSFLPDGTMGFVMPPERSANLDTMTDWHILQAMVEKGYWPLEELD